MANAHGTRFIIMNNLEENSIVFVYNEGIGIRGVVAITSNGQEYAVKCCSNALKEALI